MSGFRVASSLTPRAIPKAKPRDWTDRLFQPRQGAVEISCKECGKVMFIPPSKIGQRATCDDSCAVRFREKSERAKPWAARLFECRETTTEKPCEFCGITMHLPASKLNRSFCSSSCQNRHREAKKTARAKPCLACGIVFLPDRDGIRFCSQKCNAASGRISSAENLAAAQEGKRQAIADGRIKFKSGPENPQWKGGPPALRQRQIASGKAAAWTRRYRRENPDKIKEFSSRRKSRKLGRLPYGSIVRLRKLQSDRCAICRTKLRGRGHVDHIVPLAKGGEHKQSNLQLLCAPCNLHKSSRDPIEHMQSLGRLL